jgi:hypothetical protein
MIILLPSPSRLKEVFLFLILRLQFNYLIGLAKILKCLMRAKPAKKQYPSPSGYRPIAVPTV